MIDNYRRARRRPAEGMERELDDPAEAVERVDELLKRVLMEEALLRLSSGHRDVLVALHYRRFTVNEAAVQLNIQRHREIARLLCGVGVADRPK